MELCSIGSVREECSSDKNVFSMMTEMKFEPTDESRRNNILEFKKNKSLEYLVPTHDRYFTLYHLVIQVSSLLHETDLYT